MKNYFVFDRSRCASSCFLDLNIWLTFHIGIPNSKYSPLPNPNPIPNPNPNLNPCTNSYDNALF